MADTTQNTSTEPTAPATPPSQAKPRGQSRFQQLNKHYALPAPLRTFPLPTFVPHNPLSLFHILYVWAYQSLKKPSSHFDPLYQGWFSPETRSIHITDDRSIRGLWQQGFYGKGTLSRSEPAWLNKQAALSGAKKKITSEMVTAKRRADRQTTKWERARKERELIEETLRAEAGVVPDAGRVDVPTEDMPAPLVVEALAESVAAETEPVALEPITPTFMVEIPASEGHVTKSLPAKQHFAAPTGPFQILALPNSYSDLKILEYSLPDASETTTVYHAEDFDEKFVTQIYAPPIGPIQLLALPNSINSYPSIDLPSLETPNIEPELVPEVPHEDPEQRLEPTVNLVLSATISITSNGHGINGRIKTEEIEIVGGSDTNDDTVDESHHSETTTEATAPDEIIIPSSFPSTPTKRKSVRFSPTVEETTFIQTEPPSPPRAANSSRTTMVEAEPTTIKNQEHLQLTLSEAFFLSYALGALTILDPVTKSPIPNEDLFSLFRRTSYFPPQKAPALSPDDPFMLDYVVYHHYRSLGWTPRSGIKFSVNYMLYVRGPVFTHAEFGVLILPSYSDPYWSSTPELKAYSTQQEKRTWHWLSCINRVIGQVRKTLVLTYVDIPAPLGEEKEREIGVSGVLARYRVREVVVKRFSANRLRE